LITKGNVQLQIASGFWRMQSKVCTMDSDFALYKKFLVLCCCSYW